MRRNQTWPQLANTDFISAVEDPLTNQSIPFEEFASIYRPLLETFDGRDMEAYLDIYFEISRVDRTKLVFIDEDAQLDFRQEAIEMGLIPSVGVIMVGESLEEKMQREQKEKIKRYAIENQRQRQASKPKETYAQQHAKRVLQAQKSLADLTRKLDTASLSERSRIEKKIVTITSYLATKNNTY